MSYSMGLSGGLGGDNPCPEFVVRADGRCADSSGLHFLQWYDMSKGRCVDPPPKLCDVNAPNLAPCELYVIRADGRCEDSTGTHPLSWYHKLQKKCVEPPPFACEVNAPNLPMPTTPVPRNPPPRTVPPSVPPANPPTVDPPKKAGISPWIIGGAVVAVMTGAVLLTNKPKKPSGGSKWTPTRSKR